MTNQPKKSSFLNKITHGNLLIIGFFVLLVWILFTVLVCSNTYHVQLNRYQETLEETAAQVRESVTTAVNHSEHIIRSRSILTPMNQTDLSIPQMLAFYDYANEILANASGTSGTVRVYHTNDALYEAMRFSHIRNLANREAICAQLSSSKSSVIFTILNSNHAIVMYRKIQNQPLCILEYPILIEELLPADHSIRVTFQENTVPGSKGIMTASINDELTCVMQLPHKEITSAWIQVLVMCLIVLAFLAGLIFVLYKTVARTTVQQINDYMENLTGKTLLYEDNFLHSSYDLYELDIIKITLQKLAKEVKLYSDAIKSAELENQRLEMELLSMQLDPHMLYNSLASIRLDAYRIQNQKIMDLVDNMVLYYRDILKKDRKFVTVQQEMESIRKYLYINELSHEKKYPLEAEIAEDLQNFMIPSQILHTFVENCIVHGLSGNKKDCLIRIRMTEESGIITTEIFDNGYGIPYEKLTELNRGLQDSGHIGIQNSLKRLKLTYGEESSIRFESEKNVYTKVIVSFPRQKKGDA